MRGVDCRTLDASCLAIRMARYIAWVSNTKEVVYYMGIGYHQVCEHHKFCFLLSNHNEENNGAIECQPNYKVGLVGGIVYELEPN